LVPAADNGGVATPAPSWEVGTLARHPDRPSARELLPHLCTSFVELHGDRTGGDDPAVVCGLGLLADQGGGFVAQGRRAAGDARGATLRRSSAGSGSCATKGSSSSLRTVAPLATPVTRRRGRCAPRAIAR